MQETRDLVNSWLRALNPATNASLGDADSVDLAVNPQRSLSLYLDQAAGVLHWALPLTLAHDQTGLSDSQLTDLAALNYAQEATRGARLALVDDPDGAERVQLLYRRALSRLDQNRFITITGELIATAAALTALISAPPNDGPAFHPSV